MGDDADFAEEQAWNVGWSKGYPLYPDMPPWVSPYRLDELDDLPDDHPGSIASIMRAFFGDDIPSYGELVRSSAGRPFRPKNTTTATEVPEMTKTKLELAQEKLDGLLRQAQTQAEEVERLTDRVATYPEPGDGMMVHFVKQFPRVRGGLSREYEYAAVRIAGKWHHTGGNEATHNRLPNPASWDEVIDFADTISVAVDFAAVPDWEAKADEVIERNSHGNVVRGMFDSAAIERREEFLEKELRAVIGLLANEITPGKRASKEAMREVKRRAENGLATHDEMKRGES